LGMYHQRMSWHQCSIGKHQLFHSFILWTMWTVHWTERFWGFLDIWLPVHNVFYMLVLRDMQI
jgi:hypothetical protein